MITSNPPPFQGCCRRRGTADREAVPTAAPHPPDDGGSRSGLKERLTAAVRVGRSDTQGRCWWPIEPAHKLPAGPERRFAYSLPFAAPFQRTGDVLRRTSGPTVWSLHGRWHEATGRPTASSHTPPRGHRRNRKVCLRPPSRLWLTATRCRGRRAWAPAPSSASWRSGPCGWRSDTEGTDGRAPSGRPSGWAGFRAQWPAGPPGLPSVASCGHGRGLTILPLAVCIVNGGPKRLAKQGQSRSERGRGRSLHPA